MNRFFRFPKTKLGKRVLSAVMALALVLTLLPLFGTEIKAEENGIVFSDYEITEYRSEDDTASPGWGKDSNVVFSYDGTTAEISADSFGDSDWAVQWSIKNLTSTQEGNNVLVFDVLSTETRNIKYKLHDSDGMTSIALTAGETKHVVIKAADQSVSPFFDLSNAGAGSLTFTNFIYRAMTEEELAAIEEEAEKLSIDGDGILFETNGSISENIETYSSSQSDGGWGGDSNVQFDFEGSVATVSADSFGSNTWAVQLKVNDMTSDSEENIFEFDVLSDIDKTILYKNENTQQIQTITLEAGKVTHFVEEVAGSTLSVTLDLTGGGAGSLQIANVKFVPVLEMNKLICTTYRSQDNGSWAGDNNAEFTFNKDCVVVKADNFGWNAWGLQWAISDLVSSADENTFEFDVVSSVDKDIVFKNELTGEMHTISLKANTPAHYSENVSSSKMSATFDLSGGAVGGTLTFSHMRFGDAVAEGELISDQKGPEYDFSATEENAAKDYADPGKVKEGYELIWADEFDGNYGTANVDGETGLNLDNWAYQLGDGSTDCGNYGWGNNELQSYTDNEKNIAVNEDLNGDGIADGFLRITASYEEDGYVYAAESSKKYTSARIRTTTSTDALFNTTYGYIEARISLPATQGAWPAFWMLPQSTDIYGSWPVSGELDIMETCGGFSDGSNNMACGTLHWGTPSHVYKGSGYVELDSDYTYFHTYAVDWQPGQITWYYDGVAINTITNWESAFSGASDSLTFDAPFDQPYYLLLNLAVDGGTFGGTANKAAFKDDINMYVDYVRVYQRSDGYDEYAQRTASEDGNDDWADYAGINQIAEINESCVAEVANGDVNSLETAETLEDGKWYLAYQSDASDAAAESYTDGDGTVWAKVGVNTAGSQDYSVQLIGHFDAKAGYVYKVSFDAYADGGLIGKTVNCDAKEWKSWSTYGISSFILGSSASSYSYTFEQTENFDDCRIEFNLGAVGTGNVYISNVRVEIVDPGSLGDSDTAHSALADGNLIYNGTFDQGTKHFGYWEALDQTTVVIPRYTTEKLAESDVSVVDIASMSNYENIADGVKYYERRAQISANSGVPAIYQTGIAMIADKYTVNFDLYSDKDTSVVVSVYTTKDVDGVEVLDTLVTRAGKSYTAALGVSEMSIGLTLDEDVENAAVVISFSAGASVQLDNVSMYGASQGADVDENPLDTESDWTADNGGGTALSLDTQAGVTTLNNVSSGSTWYAPQIISSDFTLVTGQKYTVSFKFKLDGASNDTIQYIIQENGGSWHVYNNGPTTVNYVSAEADEDGFCSYSAVFTADQTLDTVHMVFGLGNSGANGNLSFSFKDVDISHVTVASSDSEDDPNEYLNEEELEQASPAIESGETGDSGADGDSSSDVTDTEGGTPSSGNTGSSSSGKQNSTNDSSANGSGRTSSSSSEWATTETLYTDADNRSMRRLVNGSLEIVGDSGVLAQGTKIKAMLLSSGDEFERAGQAVSSRLSGVSAYKVYDISMMTSAGLEIHELNGYVSVTLPAPEGLTIGDGKSVMVYRLEEDGTFTRCDTAIAEGKITFLTDHFSTYVFAEYSVASGAPDTSDSNAGVMFAALFLLGCVAVAYVFSKKRKFF